MRCVVWRSPLENGLMILDVLPNRLLIPWSSAIFHIQDMALDTAIKMFMQVSTLQIQLESHTE